MGYLHTLQPIPEFSPLLDTARLNSQWCELLDALQGERADGEPRTCMSIDYRLADVLLYLTCERRREFWEYDMLEVRSTVEGKALYGGSVKLNPADPIVHLLDSDTVSAAAQALARLTREQVLSYFDPDTMANAAQVSGMSGRETTDDFQTYWNEITQLKFVYAEAAKYREGMLVYRI